MKKIAKELIEGIIILFLMLVIIPLAFNFITLSGDGFSTVRFFIVVIGAFEIGFLVSEIIK